MYSFIPSWYAGPGDWHAHIAPWYYPAQSYEFDDTVNQVRMFRNAGEETELLCLAYSPQLRQFLHRQNLYPIPYWSVYDSLQNISFRKPAVFSYRELSWPEDVEWVHLPSRVMAFRREKKYACVEFTESGNLCWAEFYAGDEVLRRDIYDDRGFCSSSVFFREGQEVRQEYYDPYGRLRFTENLEAEDVVIARGAQPDFAKEHYESMEELITEKLSAWFVAHPDREAVVIAANRQHNGMIRNALAGIPRQKIVLSFFENRYDLEDEKALQEDAGQASLLVTDTEHTARLLEKAGVSGKKICDISPFDTRLSLGKSQQIRELKLFMPLDGLEGIFLEKALRQVFDYMKRNPDVVLLAGTKGDTCHEQLALKEKLEELLAELAVQEPWQVVLESENKEEPSEEDGAGPKEEARIIVTSYQSESDMIRILYDTRLILDVRDQPDLYLQIAGISAGIPQVNYRFTRYVKHQKDGYIIQNINYITGALEYYLDGLAGWNEALVYCVQEISRYTGGTLVEQWKKLLQEGEPA